MASPTAMDAASRTGPMSEDRKPKRWVAKATAGAHGQFRKKAEAAGESTHEFAEDHKGDSGKTGKQARLAITLMGMNKGRHDLFRKKD